MNSILSRFLVGTTIFICGQSVFAGNYADPSGFSFTYPDGWIPVNRAAMGNVNDVLPPEVKNWVAKNNVNLNQLPVMLIREGHEEFLENLNVVIHPQQIPVDESTVKKLTGIVGQQYTAIGGKVTDVQGSVQKMSSRDVIVMEYQARLPGNPFLLRQRQVSFPGGGKTYIVTCTAKADTFAKFQPAFDSVLASFQAPDPVAQGLNWNRAALTGVVGGVLGALIGVVSWLAKKFAKRPSEGQ